LPLCIILRACSAYAANVVLALAQRRFRCKFYGISTPKSVQSTGYATYNKLV